MTKLEKLERAILALTEEDQAKFRQWYAEHDARLFDQEFERDVKAGKLDALAEEALAEHRAGGSTEL